jgi:iron(III) transport system substrate-binding protein
MSMRRGFAWHAVAIAAAMGLATLAYADELPQPTREMLEALKLDSKILDGIDDEMKVPQSWVDGAKKEAPVIVYDTLRPRDWQKVYSVFSARYPYVKIDHQSMNTATRRLIMPLTALKQGRHVADVLQQLAGLPVSLRDENSFETLSDLPNYKYLPDYARTEKKITVVTRLNYWCMAYNTKAVKPSELPKTWDDLLDNPLFADKRLMIGNRPDNWILALWQTYGDAWADKYLHTLFDKLNPQLRKEGLNALVKLAGLGEGNAAVPAAMNRVGALAETGAPVGYHCPEPVTFTFAEGGILRNSPRINGAKIFLNWFISREGQIAQYWADESAPVREELRSKEFLAYPDAVVGKKMATPGDEETKIKLQKTWNDLWLNGGGTIDAKEGSE